MAKSSSRGGRAAGGSRSRCARRETTSRPTSPAAPASSSSPCPWTCLRCRFCPFAASRAQTSSGGGRRPPPPPPLASGRTCRCLPGVPPRTSSTRKAAGAGTSRRDHSLRPRFLSASFSGGLPPLPCADQKPWDDGDAQPDAGLEEGKSDWTWRRRRWTSFSQTEVLGVTPARLQAPP